MKISIITKKYTIFLLNIFNRIVLPVGFAQKIISQLPIESYLDLWHVRPFNGQKIG